MLMIISDVHANLIALKAVLESINLDEIDIILHAGDIVGYNPFPNEVIREFKNLNVRSILGNHDRAVISDDYRNFNVYASYAARWTRRKMSRESLDYMSTLPTRLEVEYDNKRILVVHGAPFDDDYYLYPHEVTENLLEEYDVLVCGHTHIPFKKIFSRGIFINPGSVGQPRDGDSRASYAIYDGQEVKIYRVEYDIDVVAEKIIEEGLPFELANRLYFGI